MDKDSPVGKQYLKHKSESIFYKDATFFSTDEVYNLFEEGGFCIERTVETVFGQLSEIRKPQELREGHGEGSFVVVVGKKN